MREEFVMFFVLDGYFVHVYVCASLMCRSLCLSRSLQEQRLVLTRSVKHMKSTLVCLVVLL